MIRISSQWLIPLAALGLAFVGILYSHHGLLELRAFQRIVGQTKSAVSIVEEENKKLRRQYDLLQDPNLTISERQVREVMGWVKPGEIVYREN